ncbi:MAG: hypothetical protein JWN55_916 [Frankiales bacterium]|nr:hypothetical protein [Frankiales bacterium]
MPAAGCGSGRHDGSQDGSPQNGQVLHDSGSRDRWLNALLERASDLALVCDPDLTIRWAGPSLVEVFGFPPEEVLGFSGRGFVHPDDTAALDTAWCAALEQPGQHVRVQIRVPNKDGRVLWVEARITNLTADPAVSGMVINVRDISEQRLAQEALERSERLHRSILEAAQQGVFVTDPEARTLFVNAAMADLVGVDLETLSTGSLWDVMDPETAAEVRDRFSRRAAGAREQYELPYRRPDGELRWLRVAASPRYDAAGQYAGSIAMFSDVTDRKELERSLQRLAMYDPLTELPNRGLVLDRLEQLSSEYDRTGADFGLLVCDVDRFKGVNDQRGHPGGDELLVALAQRLQEAAREHDTVARFGGDEFLVLCPGADDYVARRVAERLAAAVEAPFEVAGTPLQVTVSIGVAATSQVSPDELVRAADAALHAAKAAGRARVAVHDAALQDGVRDRAELLTDLRAALEDEELALHYQPILDLGTGHPVGAEALLRWAHPVRGPVAPGTFIPVAEDGGLIGDLGAWTLRRACQDAVGWRGLAAPETYVAVNLSARQLADRGIVAVVRGALADSGLPPHRLVLEVTETAVLSDSDSALGTLTGLKELGVRLALDDFGTGFSSLTYLRTFPVDAIKIDRSFVSGLGVNDDDTSIVASLISLAASVGVQVVAEGVETAAQADLLRRLGCPFGQGFLWSPAVPPGDLPPLLEQLALSRVVGRAGTSRPPRFRRSTWTRPSAEVTARLVALHASGASLDTVAAALNTEGTPTPNGVRWSRQSVARVIADQQYPDVGLLR